MAMTCNCIFGPADPRCCINRRQQMLLSNPAIYQEFPYPYQPNFQNIKIRLPLMDVPEEDDTRVC